MAFLKMALATEADVNVAYEMAHLLESVDRGQYPSDKDDEDAPHWFDEDDIDHLKALHKRVAAIAENYGSIWRLLGGWSCVTNPKNELLDLTKDTVEFHPRIAAADELLEFAQLVLRGIESGHIKAKPFLDMNALVGDSIPMRTIGDAARDVIDKATGEKA